MVTRQLKAVIIVIVIYGKYNIIENTQHTSDVRTSNAKRNFYRQMISEQNKR